MTPEKLENVEQLEPEKLENVTPDASPVLDSGAILDTFERLAADFVAGLELKTVTDLTQNQFSALCMYIGRNYIKPNERYLTRAAVNIPVRNTYGLLKNNNAFDIDKLNIIYNCFLYMANKYDKVPTIHSFAALINTAPSTIYCWKDYNGTDEVSRKRHEFYKMARQNHEVGLSDVIVSGRRNPVGAIEQLNVAFGHSAGIIRQEESARAALPVDALPRLDSIGHNAQRFNALPVHDQDEQ